MKLAVALMASMISPRRLVSASGHNPTSTISRAARARRVFDLIHVGEQVRQAGGHSPIDFALADHPSFLSR